MAKMVLNSLGLVWKLIIWIFDWVAELIEVLTRPLRAAFKYIMAAVGVILLILTILSGTAQVVKYNLDSPHVPEDTILIEDINNNTQRFTGENVTVIGYYNSNGLYSKDDNNTLSISRGKHFLWTDCNYLNPHMIDGRKYMITGTIQQDNITDTTIECTEKPIYLGDRAEWSFERKVIEFIS